MASGILFSSNGQGIMLDHELRYGKTESCRTFDNPPLVPSGDFEVKVIEVYSLVNIEWVDGKMAYLVLIYSTYSVFECWLYSEVLYFKVTNLVKLESVIEWKLCTFCRYLFQVFG